jgi:hypothetical protein
VNVDFAKVLPVAIPALFSALALGVSIYSLYRSHLQAARLQVHVADRLYLVGPLGVDAFINAPMELVNAVVHIRRTLADAKPIVETVTCFKVSAQLAEQAGERWAKRWIDVQLEAPTP